MQNLERNGNCHVMAGNKRILIADVEDVQSVELTDFMTKTVIMRTGRAFAEIRAESIQTEVTEEDGGFSHETKCRLFGVKNRYDRLFADMARRRWIVKTVDNTGLVWLSGSMEEPLRFSFSHIGQARADGEHLYELRFHRRMSEPLCATSL